MFMRRFPRLEKRVESFVMNKTWELIKTKGPGCVNKKDGALRKSSKVILRK